MNALLSTLVQRSVLAYVAFSCSQNWKSIGILGTQELVGTGSPHGFLYQEHNNNIGRTISSLFSECSKAEPSLHGELGTEVGLTVVSTHSLNKLSTDWSRSVVISLVVKLDGEVYTTFGLKECG